jgi:glycosyltransferase involved in cell wall biosynthesis
MQMLTDKKISVVVVCYRDAGSIRELYRSVKDVLEKITPHYEIIYVNDASPDNAEEILSALAQTEPALTVVTHSRNFGAQVAFTSGLWQSDGDATVIMDGDMQDPPGLIYDFVQKWLEGYSVVYGIRTKRREAWSRQIGYKIFYRMFKQMASFDVPLDAGEFSLMDKIVVDVILACRERNRLIRGLRAYAGFRQIGIPFVRPKRFSGESTQSFIDYINWGIKGLISFSVKPLKFISVLSFTVTLLTVFTMVLYFVLYLLFRTSPSGFMTLLLIILFLGAVQLFCFSIVAEYLAQIFEEIKYRPINIVNKIVNDHRKVPRPWLGNEGSSSAQ